MYMYIYVFLECMAEKKLCFTSKSENSSCDGVTTIFTVKKYLHLGWILIQQSDHRKTDEAEDVTVINHINCADLFSNNELET